MHIVNTMAKLSRGKRLAQALLTWVICAARPVTTDELYYALQIDIGDHIDSVEKSIASTCGQLVYVDTSSHVQMVHQTARDFLLKSDNVSEFAINGRIGHGRLLLSCIQYLCSSEMTGPKPRKLSASIATNERCAFVAYACTAWYEHIAFVSSEDDEIMASLAKFLDSSNVLAWIDHVAKYFSLDHIVRSGNALRKFYQRRSRNLIPIGKEVALLDDWSLDLVRLVTKFGRQLVSTPSSIYQLIPPFCPSNTAVKRQFASSSRSISVNGLSARFWDDCSSTISFQQLQLMPNALSSSYRGFTVGLSNGEVRVYNDMTCQHIRTISHGESVRMLMFSRQGDILASAGATSVRLWDAATWEQLWDFYIHSDAMSLSFADNDQILLATLRSNQVLLWNLITGSVEELASWLDELTDMSSGQYHRPIATAFSEDSSHLAISYRGHDVIIWDIEEERIIDLYGQDTGSLGAQSISRPGVATIWSLEYCRTPASNLLAAACNDGSLIVFNTANGTVQARAQEANVKTLVSSRDGFTLACGSSGGTIQLFDFETLKLLHRIKSEEFSIKDLTFSGDNHRLIDIRGPHCRVWDPPVLMRQENDEDISDTVSISTAPQEYKVDDSKLDANVTAFACAECLDAVFCGTIDGAILLYDNKSGQRIRELYHHNKGISIIALCFDPRSHTLSSADSSSRVIAHVITSHNTGDLYAGTKLKDTRTGIAIDYLLINPGSSRLLISSPIQDLLWSLEQDDSKRMKTLNWPRQRSYRWITHPANKEHLLLFIDNAAHIYDWYSLTRLTSDSGVILKGSMLSELTINSIMPTFDAKVIATTFAESLVPMSKSKLLLWNVSELSIGSESAKSIPHYQALADQVDHVVGVFGRRLVFLHHDGWVCSADSLNFEIEKYDRHFFFPADWLSTGGSPMFDVFSDGRIVFIKRDEVAIIKRGLDHFEQNRSRASSKKPSVTGSFRSGSNIAKRGHSLPFR